MPDGGSAIEALPEPPSWTGGQSRRLGEALRDDRPVPSTGPSYEDVMFHYNDLAAAVREGIDALDWEPLLPGQAVNLTARPKTIDTLTDKLRRDRNTPLGNVQDLAGVRFEAEMTLDEQDAVARAIAAMYGHDPDGSCIHDLRQRPHAGYRAVHVWLRLPPGRVEVQVRTHIQGAWANAYESLADVVGREIRYAEHPAGVVDARHVPLVDVMQGLSEQGALLEDLKVRVQRLMLSGVEDTDDVKSEVEGVEKDYTLRMRQLHDAFTQMRLG